MVALLFLIFVSSFVLNGVVVECSSESCPIFFNHTKVGCEIVQENEICRQRLYNCVNEMSVGNINGIKNNKKDYFWCEIRNLSQISKSIILIFFYKCGYMQRNILSIDCSFVSNYEKSCTVKPNVLNNRFENRCKNDFFYYYDSLIPVCISDVTLKNGTREDLEKFCHEKSGRLIGEGIIYLNTDYEIPTSILIMDDGQLQHENVPDSNTFVLNKLKNFCTNISDSDNKYISISNRSCLARNESFIYDRVICEHDLDEKHITFKRVGTSHKTANEKGKILFELNSSVDVGDVACYVDNNVSYIRGFKQVNWSKTDNEKVIELNAEEYGEYVCVNNMSTHIHTAMSPAVFYLNSTDNINHKYILDYKNHTAFEFCERLGRQQKVIECKSSIWSKYGSYIITTTNDFIDYIKINPFHIKNCKIKSLLCDDDFQNIITEDGSCVDKNERPNRLYSWNDTKCISREYKCIHINESIDITYHVFENRYTLCETHPSICHIRKNVMQINNVIDEMLESNITNENELQRLTRNISDALFNSDSFPKNFSKHFDDVLLKINTSNGQFDYSSSKLSVGVVKIDRKKSECRVKLGSSIEFVEKGTEGNITETDVIVDLEKLNGIGNLAVVAVNDGKILGADKNLNGSKLNSIIIGIVAASNGNISIDIHFKSFETKSNDNLRCKFWNDTSEEWSDKGCKLINEEDINISDEHKLALTIISHISCFLSLFGLAIIAMTAIVFKQWRTEITNKIYLNLSVSVALLCIAFLCNTPLENILRNDELCTAFGALLHYSVLAMFLWMFIIAMMSYKKLVIVFGYTSNREFFITCIIGWLLPLIPVVLLLSSDHGSYSRQNNNTQIYDFHCYPSDYGFWFSVLLPIIIILIANTYLYFTIVLKVFFQEKNNKTGTTMSESKKVSITFLMFTLYGLSWIFGLTSGYAVMNYVFCLLVPLQGFIMFIYFIILNSNTRGMWLNKLHFKRFEKFYPKNTNWLFKSNYRNSSTKSTTGISDLSDESHKGAPTLLKYRKNTNDE